MIEVFKTDVMDCEQARIVLDLIHGSFVNYRANFDLQDCDHILRVRSLSGEIDPDLIIALVNESGFTAEILPEAVIS